MATPQEIDQAAQCYCTSNYQRAVLYLLDQVRIAQGGSVMTVQEIDAASQCYCIANFEKAVLYLLANISGGSGGSGSFAGSGSPEGVVTANPGATYIDTAGGIFYVKFTGTGNTGWAPIV